MYILLPRLFDFNSCNYFLQFLDFLRSFDLFSYHIEGVSTARFCYFSGQVLRDISYAMYHVLLVSGEQPLGALSTLRVAL